MKISRFLRCTLLTILICGFSTAAQDYTQFSLPEGAIARLGKGKLGQIHFSPDGRVLAVSSSIGIWFHDPQTGKELDLLVCPAGITPFAFGYAPDGKTIATGSTNEMIVITGRREARLSSSAGNTVQLRDVTTGKKKTTLNLQTQRAASIVYSPDGNTIATARKSDNTVYLWDAATGASKGTLERYAGKGNIKSFVYSPDGNTIATAGGRNDNTVQLYDTHTGKHKATLTGHTKAVNSVAYSSDGNTIAAGSTDGTVRLWDVATRTQKATLKHISGIASLLPWYYVPVNAVAYSPDGNTLATRSTDGTALLWEIKPTSEAE